jgi:pyruvate dehydrogenase E1 component
VKVLPDVIDRWLPRRLHSLGTDGFGRSDTRAALRDFFEVDARFITLSTLHALLQEKQVPPEVVQQAIKDLGIDIDKRDPAVS